VPTVVAVGLGPADEAYVTPRARSLLDGATTARLRTRRHPAAGAFPAIESFDALYDTASSFEELYQAIADELVALARADASSTAVYAVPGSPLVAERTVELLAAREDVELVIEPAISFVDLACAAVRLDPVAAGLRVGDALDERSIRGPGPILLAQAHSSAVLTDLSLRLGMDLDAAPSDVVVLHHLGLDDEQVLRCSVADLAAFPADHLTSILIPQLRTSGVAVEDLKDVMDALRERCPWDEVQTHGSLERYLLEETYEALDAIESLVAALDAEAATGASPASRRRVDVAASHVREELGDVLLQVVFHARLASEEGLFDLTSVADDVREKLVRRHPHVFSDAVAATPDAVASRWEELKQEEKGRASVTDGIPDALPALALMAKVRRKAMAVGIDLPPRAALVAEVHRALLALPEHADLPDDAALGEDPDATEAIGSALAAICDLARAVGVDPELALRARARALVARVRDVEVAAGT
jgi:tetrapyrrole methylase family protein/MazG family protein